jgi:hypothetical protein
MNLLTEQERDLLIDRYLNGRLNEVELASFEIRLLEDLALFDAVQIAAALKQGLREHAEILDISHKQSSIPVMLTSNAKILPFRQWLRQPLSMAASLMVAALGVTQLVGGLNQTAPTLGAGGNSLTQVNTVMLFENSRGSNVLEFSGPPPYLLQLDAGVGSGNESFAVEITSSNEDFTLAIPAVMSDSDGWLRVVVADELPQRFTVSLTSAATSQEVKKFTAELSK